jgi:hypothetical protein
MIKVATQIKTTIYDHNGKPESVKIQVGTDSFASAYVEVCHDDWQRHGWREEIYTLAGNKSVQCLYDSRGIIWYTHELTLMDTLPSGQPII